MLRFKGHTKKEIALEGKKLLVVFQRWEKMKQKFACHLQQQSEFLSLTSKKIILIAFFMVSTTGCIFIIINAWVNGNSIVGIKQISEPASTKDNPDIATKSDSVITEKDYKRIELFKSYLIQLRDDSTNRRTFDSIMLQRPGLFDSITLFEKMYLSQ